MALGFPTDFKELVRSRTDLVELIGESVALEPERGGRGFQASDDGTVEDVLRFLNER